MTVKKTFMTAKLLFIASLCLLGNELLKAQDLSPEEELNAKVLSIENSVRLLQKFKISGYIQAQYQYAQTDADGINFKLAKARNAYEQTELKDFSRFGLRRGRIKLTYEDGLASGVVQNYVNDKGIDDNGRNAVTFKDIYLQVKDPWAGSCNLKAGIFERTFGHEIAYSSSRRESPERSRIFQTLFPDERDLGVAITLQPSKSSPLNIFKLEAGLFAGNGIKPQISGKMDFIGHLSVNKQIDANTIISGGLSAYLGGILQTGNPEIYEMKDKAWVLKSDDTDNIGKYVKRQYIGLDAQFSTMSAAGLTQLRSEYIFGEHAQNAAGSWNYKFTALQSGPVYMRKISGGYVILTQDLGKTPFTAIVKYDWYNPNTKISGNDIGASSLTTSNDISKSVIGLGMYWRINPALRLTAYYDIVSNETSAQLTDTKDETGKITAYGWDKKRKADVFTLRLQYKF
jgi:hypothetical protein